MISDRRLITIFLLAAICLLPLACGVRVSISSDAGSISEEISASRNDGVKSSTAIGADSLSHFIEGSGSFKDSHSVSNKAGANARVSVDIRNAEKYSYDYHLSADKAPKSAPVMAGEELNVLNAKYIQASARASNEKGYKADISTVIYDPGNQASLTGYQNIAMASSFEAMVSQIAEGASAPSGYILADSTAGFTQLRSKPLQFREDEANEGAQIDYGSIEGYSDLASASANGVMASQQMVAAMGNQIQTKSQSESLTASLFQSLKKTDAKVGSTVEGTLAGYNGSAYASKNYAEAGQTGHVSGTFSSTALAGKERKTKNSNYPEYGFEMKAKKGATGSSASGTLEFYVDDDDPSIGSIQSAVDASDSGDAVNVAPGTYYENVQVDKSLAVNGAGASDTIVDGHQAGSVFTIGRDNPNANVTLSGMTIQGGTGAPVEIFPGWVFTYGGGIRNSGTLKLKDSTISGNAANYGGGIYSSGIAMIADSTISGNIAANDGGGIYNDGTATVAGSTISGNTAANDGGGIYNMDTFEVTGSKIYENTANHGFGGGISNYGTTTVMGSDLSENAASFGGGISNRYGSSLANIIGSNISENTAYYYGGGIINDGTAAITGGIIYGNIAICGGGGIYNEYGTVTVTSNKISNNAAYDGGGVSNYYGTAMITDSNLSDNAAYNYGGGIENSGINTIIDSTISGNTAVNNGGGIDNNYGGTTAVTGSTLSKNTAIYGGGIYNYYNGATTITGSNISKNTADYGSGIYNYDGPVTVTGSKISGNTAAYEGGGIFNVGGGTATVTDSNISENTAVSGGGIYSVGTVTMNNGSINENTANYGGGIYNFYGTVNLNSGSVDHNTAYYVGGGIYNEGTITGNKSLVHDNSPDDIWPWLPEV